jgi:hypothetical protein
VVTTTDFNYQTSFSVFWPVIHVSLKVSGTLIKGKSKTQVTVGFWCQTIHEKFLRRFDTILGLKMMVKSGLEKIILKFNNGLKSCFCPVQKNLPRKAELAWQVSRYHRGISKYFFLDHFSPSFLSQQWCQISLGIFCVLLGTKNLQ